MSARAKTKKCQGVVVDGRIRDLAEHRTMQFPVSVKRKHCHLLPIYTAERCCRI
jgi:regulator of RNase E activity RraA